MIKIYLSDQISKPDKKTSHMIFDTSEQHSKGLPISDIVINYTPGYELFNGKLTNDFIGFNKNREEQVSVLAKRSIENLVLVNKDFNRMYLNGEFSNVD